MRIVLVVLLIACGTASAQTTFILVRHAEKESAGTFDPKDPPLSKEGEARAQSLARMLEKQSISVILSTNFARTKNTVKPVADAKGIPMQTYESLKEPQLEELISKHVGGTVLVVGHSNTIPALTNLLIGKDTFKNFEDSDYGNIFVITVSSVGKGQLTHLRY